MAPPGPRFLALELLCVLSFPPTAADDFRRDLRLSSLKRYVEASGGKVRLDIELPDGSHYQFHL